MLTSDLAKEMGPLLTPQAPELGSLFGFGPFEWQIIHKIALRG